MLALYLYKDATDPGLRNRVEAAYRDSVQSSREISERGTHALVREAGAIQASWYGTAWQGLRVIAEVVGGFLSIREVARMLDPSERPQLPDLEGEYGSYVLGLSADQVQHEIAAANAVLATLNARALQGTATEDQEFVRQRAQQNLSVLRQMEAYQTELLEFERRALVERRQIQDARARARAEEEQRRRAESGGADNRLTGADRAEARRERQERQEQRERATREATDRNRGERPETPESPVERPRRPDLPRGDGPIIMRPLRDLGPVRRCRSPSLPAQPTSAVR